MKARAMKRRHRLRLPGPAITGEVSREDVHAYLRATGWLDGSPHWLTRGSESVPLPSRGDYRLEELVALVARAEHRSPGETLRAIEARALGLSPTDRAPHVLRLAEEDLSSIADETGVLDGLPGVRPWDPQALWRAVLDLGVRAAPKRQRKPRDWERFQQALGALKVLDVLDRAYVRRW
ncbi:hypothetical protein WMF31_00850 [Sorangium sp. So ce1036]|uniref:hypothetical protein n=1 Tax=Sorangium sp. So ce1036 TaxID=3133328 RepID=UPI003F07F4D4